MAWMRFGGCSQSLILPWLSETGGAVTRPFLKKACTLFVRAFLLSALLIERHLDV